MLAWLRREQKESPAATLGALQIVRPWARASATMPWTAGAYVTLVNDGPADRLLYATSDVAGWTEIHGIKVVGANLQMRCLEGSLAVPAKNTIVLKPRGYHLLMTGLAEPLVVGASFPLTLAFETGGQISVDFKVEAPGPVGQSALVEPT